VDEAQWLACNDPPRMLQFLGAKISERKLRLLTCGACRRLWHVLRAEACRKVVEVAEAHADGLATAVMLAAAGRPAREAATAAEQARSAGWNAALTAAAVAGPPREAAERAVRKAAGEDLLRDLFGNPFRPVAVEPAWLAWNGGAVAQLARAAYADRLPSGILDRARLAVLADALEESGCAEQELLAHLRAPGPHVRGCFVIDALTGRE
jgi:hypothetical protein